MTKFTQEVSDVIAMLEQENRLIRARNERLEKEVEELTETIKKLKIIFPFGNLIFRV